MRPKGAPVFSARDIKLLRCVEPVLCALSAAHWRTDPRLEITKPALDKNEILRETIQNALIRLEIPALTPRETEVVGLVLQGHSSESIANILHTSSGTVRIHRKNVYAKMRISSQRELFSAFMDLSSRPNID
ncbi:helix-turn-helix transcriptional regulator [Paraburkholderia aspalathi]|nr:helix-turn-helix transcriptional regulator [Paraburkholderia aspalathi]